MMRGIQQGLNRAAGACFKIGLVLTVLAVIAVLLI